jgi:hypothetical protein
VTACLWPVGPMSRRPEGKKNPSAPVVRSLLLPLIVERILVFLCDSGNIWGQV